MTAKEIINAILMQENITGSQLAKDMDSVDRKRFMISLMVRFWRWVREWLILSIRPSLCTTSTGYWQERGEHVNADIPATSIKAEKPNEQIDSLSVINHLIEINAQKDVEIRELRQAYEHLARCFEKLANGETIAPADKKANSI